MQVHKPPARWTAAPGATVVFLAGSIEMGRAAAWQEALISHLAAHVRTDLVALNPRRDAWDASWRQSIDEPKFRDQVEWELDGLERADVIALWLAPDTRSPVSLLELGLHARGGKLVVGCPDGFWRKGNVEVVCARFAVPLATDWDAFVAEVSARCAARSPGWCGDRS
ncbi:MAG TPA: nucleoside 2-deoxyribosyltransferase domain-containing protein [Kofleriaceae bacterium]|nr:nucleoside 2-deoxyribosyltransferase domain-containing protein [Kofleriaceae bacterium]